MTTYQPTSIGALAFRLFADTNLLMGAAFMSIEQIAATRATIDRMCREMDADARRERDIDRAHVMALEEDLLMTQPHEWTRIAGEGVR